MHNTPRRVITSLALAALAALLLAPAPAAAQSPPPTPQVFSDLPFLDAKAKAEAEGKILFINGVRADCDECPDMDREVFQNPRVIAWLRDNAVSLKIDADTQPGEALRLKLGPFPSNVVIRDGRIIDRIDKPLSPAEFLNFVKAAARGRTTGQRIEQEYRRALREGFERNADKRYELAQKLLHHDRYEAATEEFLFLWNNVLDLAPRFAETRHNLMAEKIKTLVFKHPPAREAFTALRDELTPRVDPERADDIDPETLQDWIVLNNIIRDWDAVISWTENVAENHDPALLEEGDQPLFNLLIKRFQWRLAGLVYRDPMTYINARMAKWGDRLGTHPAIDSYFLEDVGNIYGALLAADRIDDAIAVANFALDFKNEGITYRRLTNKAELAGVPEHLQQVWKIEGPMPPE